MTQIDLWAEIIKEVIGSREAIQAFLQTAQCLSNFCQQKDNLYDSNDPARQDQLFSPNRVRHSTPYSQNGPDSGRRP